MVRLAPYPKRKPGVVEVVLQCPEAGDPRHQLTDDAVRAGGDPRIGREDREAHIE